MSKYEMAVADMPPGERVLARRPVAAAAVTLQTRSDGHREMVAQRLSDARAAEFPLPWLVDQALVEHAPVIITAADRALLAADATKRRFFAEPQLAALCDGRRAVDPLTSMGATVDDEAALRRRLEIAFPQVNDADVERGWNAHVPDAAEEVALGVAAARLAMWAHGGVPGRRALSVQDAPAAARLDGDAGEGGTESVPSCALATDRAGDVVCGDLPRLLRGAGRG